MKAVAVEGYRIMTCPCCGAWPIRDTWLRACRQCGAEQCAKGMPEGETECRACRGEGQDEEAPPVVTHGTALGKASPR